MSGTPKRLHEEGGRPATSKHATEESNSFHSNHPGYHPSPHFESGQDGRLMKNARSDGDKRSPLNSMYRLSSSLNDSGLDQQVGVENRIEVREAKESRDLKVENRDGKVETRDETQGGKGEKLARFDSRGDDSKEMKYHRQQIDSRDVSMGTLWKESKEQQRGKRFPEASGERGDMWRVSPCNVHVASEIGKEGPVDEVNEIVGENKVEFRGDDKMKDRERKKKDEKHREWGERDKDRNDRQSNLQTGNGVNEHREMTREERDERWERERKDAQKEKERPKDREKDHIKKEPLNAVEKESLHNEKELADGSVRIPEQESSALEQRRPKEFESWKSVDRDAKDRHIERDVEADRNEKRNRGNDKESDDAFVDGDGVERERDGFSHGVQQRKRMVRPRGSPQLANKERLRSRPRENEESEDKTEVSTVVYKVGECMQELIKLWKEFEASQDKSDEIPCNGPTLEIRIPSEYVTATNRQVRGGQLWGTDIYTDDSDLVAVLMHTGYCRPTASPPPPAIQELRATIRILPPQDCYTSTLRNNVRSRAWGAAIGCSYRVDRCCIIKKGGGSIDLEPCLTHTSSVEPTLAPVAVERTITTRAAASNALRQQKFMREVTIQYNLCNEPWIKYSINIVADKGLKKPLYTSARLKKGEVLYLETHSNRYELCFNGERMVGTTAQASEMDIDKSQNHNSHEQNGERSTADRETTIDVFRWSRCKMALPQNIMRSIGIPLPLEHITVLEDGLEWEDVQWSQTGVWIAGKEYALARVHFLSPN